MFQLFVTCAAFGGTLLILQFAMSSLGLLGEHDADLDHDGDVDSLSGESLFGESHAAGGANDPVALQGEAESLEVHDGEAHAGLSPEGESHGAHHAERLGSTGLFRLLSFRTVVAAITFFGLAGTASLQAKLGAATSGLIAVGAGFAALFVVYRLARVMRRFDYDGTLDLRSVIGQAATVYVPVPPQRLGRGKVHVPLMTGMVECQAESGSERKLATGTKVKVTGVVEPGVVEIEPDDDPWLNDPLRRAAARILADVDE